MIVTVGNTKGGVGKTTLSVQIAIARALAGRSVWLVDGDRQGTAMSAISLRDEAGRLPALACSQYVDGPKMRSQVKHQASRWDDVVIDVGGQDSSAMRAALSLTDVLLVPFQPRSFDVWALAQIDALIADARSVRDDLVVYAILNCADPTNANRDNADAIEALEDYPQITHLDAPIRRRKAFSNASGQGLSVLELPTRDPRAVAELDTLISTVFCDLNDIKIVSE